ncbi:hypothetical protein CRG98_029885 [Punica granatum]|uniref:3-hydroxyisobutyryl-CoA hydrolase n=1 Tax=Punica granatum TaxID=22663 RepID=A0A2I0J0F8_PUNGR|nr:hypothetical protein CRG98_029885 [Punica granatum]
MAAITFNLQQEVDQVSKILTTVERYEYDPEEDADGELPRCYFQETCGEYLALTGARVDGPEMVACGLASHFVPSKRRGYPMSRSHGQVRVEVDLTSSSSEVELVEERARGRGLNEHSFAGKGNMRAGFIFLYCIKYFSDHTEENEVTIGAEKWIKDAYRSMKSASPTSLKIREGRRQNLEQCLFREFFIFGHMVRGTINRDFYEGSRALLFDKDKKPKWNPPSLELVTEEIVNKFFEDIDDPDLGPLLLPRRSHDLITAKL